MPVKRCVRRALVFVLVMTATLVGASDRKVVVGFVQDTLANDWRLAQVQQLEAELKAVPNVEFIYVDARGNAAQQVIETEKMLERGVDILIASPRDSDMMTPVISRAYKQGTKVILLTRSINTEDYTSFIAPDDAAIARQSAAFLAKQLKGKGRILMIRGVSTATTAKLRTAGFLDELEKYPGLHLVATVDGNYQRQDTMLKLDALLGGGMRFDAIYAQSDSMATGARIVLNKYGIDPAKLVIVGIDYITESRAAIQAGQQTASFTYPTCGAEAAQAVRDMIAGKAVAKKVKVPSVMVTRENTMNIKPIF